MYLFLITVENIVVIQLQFLLFTILVFFNCKILAVIDIRKDLGAIYSMQGLD